jgi:hypothetical protein
MSRQCAEEQNTPSVDAQLSMRVARAHLLNACLHAQAAEQTGPLQHAPGVEIILMGYHLRLRERLADRVAILSRATTSPGEMYSAGVRREQDPATVALGALARVAHSDRAGLARPAAECGFEAIQY